MVYNDLIKCKFLKTLKLNQTYVEHADCGNRTHRDNTYNLQLYAPPRSKISPIIKYYTKNIINDIGITENTKNL